MRPEDIERIERLVVIDRAPCPHCQSIQYLDGRRIGKHCDASKRTFCKGVGVEATVFLAWKYTELLRRTAAALASAIDQIEDGDGLSEGAVLRLSERIEGLECEQRIRRRELAAMGRMDILDRHDALEKKRPGAGRSRQGHGRKDLVERGADRGLAAESRV